MASSPFPSGNLPILLPDGEYWEDFQEIMDEDAVRSEWDTWYRRRSLFQFESFLTPQELLRQREGLCRREARLSKYLSELLQGYCEEILTDLECDSTTELKGRLVEAVEDALSEGKLDVGQLRGSYMPRPAPILQVLPSSSPENRQSSSPREENDTCFDKSDGTLRSPLCGENWGRLDYERKYPGKKTHPLFEDQYVDGNGSMIRKIPTKWNNVGEDLVARGSPSILLKRAHFPTGPSPPNISSVVPNDICTDIVVLRIINFHNEHVSFGSNSTSNCAPQPVSHTGSVGPVSTTGLGTSGTFNDHHEYENKNPWGDISIKRTRNVTTGSSHVYQPQIHNTAIINSTVPNKKALRTMKRLAVGSGLYLFTVIGLPFVAAATTITGILAHIAAGTSITTSVSILALRSGAYPGKLPEIWTRIAYGAWGGSFTAFFILELFQRGTSLQRRLLAAGALVLSLHLMGTLSQTSAEGIAMWCPFVMTASLFMMTCAPADFDFRTLAQMVTPAPGLPEPVQQQHGGSGYRRTGLELPRS